jgi:chromosome partitioning protein
MRVIAVVNQKGGTGKTTTTVNLAAAIAESGRTVLVVDLDSQRNATEWLGAVPGEYDVLSVLMREAGIDDAAVPAAVPGVEVVPATAELTGVERGLSNKPGIELRLKRALYEARPRDVVLIDCLPALGLLTVSGLVAADEVLVPVLPGGIELAAVAELVDTVAEVGDGLNPGLTIGHVLVVAADQRQRLDLDVIAALRERFPDATLQTVIGRSVRIRESYNRHQPITVFDPHGKASQQYRDAARELLQRERTPA